VLGSRRLKMPTCHTSTITEIRSHAD